MKRNRGKLEKIVKGGEISKLLSPYAALNTIHMQPVFTVYPPYDSTTGNRACSLYTLTAFTVYSLGFGDPHQLLSVTIFFLIGPI